FGHGTKEVPSRRRRVKVAHLRPRTCAAPTRAIRRRTMDSRPDPHLKRLFVRAGLSAGAGIEIDRSQANYLVNVLRMRDGGELLVVNGRDGEWRAVLESRGKKAHALRAVTRTRAQTAAPDLHYLFAPLKQARLDYM